jgi:hypothetical protein
MTWQGGKRHREVPLQSPFAKLKPLVVPQHDTATSMTHLAHALSDFGHAVRLHIRLVSGKEGESVEHWHVHSGIKSPQAVNEEPKKADVVVVMRPDTWSQIAQGQLAPYEALYTGRLRVGGNFRTAKAITQHLSDAAASYVAPC